MSFSPEDQRDRDTDQEMEARAGEGRDSHDFIWGVRAMQDPVSLPVASEIVPVLPAQMPDQEGHRDRQDCQPGYQQPIDQDRR